MKKEIFAILMLYSTSVYSQIGINTTSPQSTLDIRAKNHLGAVTANDGVLVPRVNSLATAGTTNGQLVYLIGDDGGFTKGFHFWNGTQWTPLASDGDAWGITGEDQISPISRSGSVAIGITGANSYAKLDVSSNNQGILIPRINLTSNILDLNTDGNNNISDQPSGLLIYNNGTTYSKGFYFWNGMEWRTIDNSTAISPIITNLVCQGAYLNPSSYTAGQVFTGSLKVPYNGGNGGAYTSGTPFTINGLTFTLRSGKLEFGSGELLFSVSGTPTSNGDMTVLLNNTRIPFITATQSCTSMISNQLNADIKSVAVMGYPTASTDANGKQGYSIKLLSPDGNYGIRVFWNVTNGNTGGRPNVQIINNTGSDKNLYWNYETIYGGIISSAGILPIPSGTWGGNNDAPNSWSPQTTGAMVWWGNEGIYDAVNNGPEYRRYTWIDDDSTTKVAYSVFIMAGSSSGNSSPTPNSTKVYMKIEQVKAP